MIKGQQKIGPLNPPPGRDDGDAVERSAADGEPLDGATDLRSDW